MGCGAIFRIRRVQPIKESLTAHTPVTETDPHLLREMVSLVAAQKLEAVSLAEMRRRLVERDLKARFVCFTFDGAYRGIQDIVLPLFRKRGIPFAVYVASDYLDSGRLPWWLALSELISAGDRIVIELSGEAIDIRCKSLAEKQQATTKLFRRLTGVDRQSRIAIIDAALKQQGLTQADAAKREMLSGAELKALADTDLVTLGTMGGGSIPLSEMSDDRASETVKTSIEALEQTTGHRPADLAFPGAPASKITPRDVQVPGEIGLQTAVTNIEGALWPEHAGELLALPRIALDNDPATLVRALMLGGGSAPSSRSRLERSAG